MNRLNFLLVAGQMKQIGPVAMRIIAANFIFAAVGHPDLHPENDEVTEGKWWTQAELTAAIGKDLLTPNFEAEYARIQGMLLALL